MSEHDRVRSEILSEYAQMRKILDGLLELHDQRAEVEFHELEDSLIRLRTSMEKVFASEEQRGLFKELLSLLPNESERIGSLRNDHVSLLERVKELIERARHPDRESLTGLRQDVERFADQLEDHEAWEVRLFNRPHLREEGAED